MAQRIKNKKRVGENDRKKTDGNTEGEGKVEIFIYLFVVRVIFVVSKSYNEVNLHEESV